MKRETLVARGVGQGTHGERRDTKLPFRRDWMTNSMRLQRARSGRGWLTNASPGWSTLTPAVTPLQQRNNRDWKRTTDSAQRRSHPTRASEVDLEKSTIYAAGRSSVRDLHLARCQPWPVSLTHPEMPNCCIECSIFVARKNDANPPRWQRFDESDLPAELLASLPVRRKFYIQN